MREGLADVVSIDVRCDLFDAGFHPEDGPGLPYGSNNHYGEVFYIEAETPNGFRFQSTQVFSDGLHLETENDYSDEGRESYCFFLQADPKAGDHAADFAAYIQRFVTKGGKLDPRHWFPIQGSYDSAGWDEQAEIELEAREREEEGW